MTATVLLVDDHELIRQGLARAFERDEQMEVVAQAGNLAQARAAFATLRPDIVVTDLQLPDGSGLELVAEIRRDDARTGADTGLVVVTMHDTDEQLFLAMEAGASAFVTKGSRSTEVVSAARHAVVAPRTFTSAGLAGAMLRRAQNPTTPKLSARESEVLGLLAEGLGTATIAGRLYMSESTAKTHISRIYSKLRATNRAQALVTAMRLGMLSQTVGA